MRAQESGLVLDDYDSVSTDSDEPKRWARKYINPAASFRDDCPSYDCLQQISPDVCRKILDNNKLKKSSEFEVLTAYRHIFDNRIVDSRTELDHRRTVFDRVMRDKQSRRVLVNRIVWKDRQRIEVLEELYGSENPFKPAYEEVDRVLELIGTQNPRPFSWSQQADGLTTIRRFNTVFNKRECNFQNMVRGLSVKTVILRIWSDHDS